MRLHTISYAVVAAALVVVGAVTGQVERTVKISSQTQKKSVATALPENLSAFVRNRGDRLMPEEDYRQLEDAIRRNLPSYEYLRFLPVEHCMEGNGPIVILGPSQSENSSGADASLVAFGEVVRLEVRSLAGAKFAEIQEANANNPEREENPEDHTEFEKIFLRTGDVARVGDMIARGTLVNIGNMPVEVQVEDGEILILNPGDTITAACPSSCSVTCSGGASACCYVSGNCAYCKCRWVYVGDCQTGGSGAVQCSIQVPQ